MKKIEQPYELTNADIIELEDFQRDLSLESVQTKRKIILWNNIENILKAKFDIAEQITDKRQKLEKYGFLIFLGAIRRIDYSKSSFLRIAYLDINSHSIIKIDKCISYSVK